ncbi:hypothetical protein Fmac_025915 [Flemingia macrophylla]|uniref:Fe2OG dioxygenase domain-containing protein n=1 Tax=Flemingia macrophylla TaxID=520843 RepID=A0ABD1LDD8_9FABA
MDFVPHSGAALDESLLVNTCNDIPSNMFTGVPEVDLSDPRAKTLMVKACQNFGLFKVLNHGVPVELITNMESEALHFFTQKQSHKDHAGPPEPFGYGTRKIGPNGDMGWLEYLLFILELMADGLEIETNNVFSMMIRGERSDSCLRINHYPACSELEKGQKAEALSGGNLIGFGEHTDPQIISIIRSNESEGLQVFLEAETWVSIPPDQTCFFVIVGDLLQVMTNGKFKSLKHRVLTNSSMSRLSLIYFGGPPLDEKIAPLPSLVPTGEESLYKEFTWQQYKTAAYKSRLSDNRLSRFEKSAIVDEGAYGMDCCHQNCLMILYN